MCSYLSRFLSNITRTKTHSEDDDSKLDFLEGSGRVSVLKSVERLLGASFNSAIFIVIGVAVKCIAGPAMVLSVILGAVFTILNSLSLCELCSRFPTKTSYYAIIYDTVGELCAFIIAWFQLLRAMFMISLVSVAAGECIYYLADPPTDISWLPPHKMLEAIELDTLVFTVVFLVALSLVVLAGLPYCSAYLTTLFWINSIAFLFMFVVIVCYASTLHWVVPENFQPFKFTGTIQGTAVTLFFFTHIDRIIEQTSDFKSAEYVVPVSLGVSLLCVFVYYLCATIFLTNLMPFNEIAQEATIPKAFASATFYESKYVLSAVALLIFCLTLMEAYFGAQRALNLLVEDGLMHNRFSKSKKKTAVLSVLSIVFLSLPLFILVPVKSLIQGFCISTLIIVVLINCTTIIVQYQPPKETEEETSVFPNWECTKSLVIRFILCFGYITHEKLLSTLGAKIDIEPTMQTSKLINWCVLIYVPSCLGLALAMIYGLPGLGENRWVVLGAVIFLLATIFLNLRVILMQPRGKSFFFENTVFASVIPLLNIGLSTILLVTMDWIAFTAVGVWTGLGLVIYFVYGMFKSHEAVFNRIQPFGETSPGRVRFDSPPQLSTSLRNVQPENTDIDSQQFLFSDNIEMLDFPQKK